MSMATLFSSSGIFHLPRPGWLSDYLHSRLRPPDIDMGTVAEILGHYALALTQTPRNLPNTRRNHNLIIDTTGGQKILKLYRADWQPGTIAYEHSILNRLVELRFPVPRLTPAQDGRTWLTLGRSHYCVFDFIPGRNYSSSFLIRPQRVRMMATAGATLAKLHHVLRGFVPQGQHHLGFKAYDQDRQRDMAWHTEKVRDLAAKSQQLRDPQAQADAHWLIEHSAEVLADMTQADHTLQTAALPRVIIHGDYGLHNLIYQSLDLAVPVDYELARLEWRLCDLVSVVSKFRYKNGEYDVESISTFIHAYQREYPIPRDEWQYFPLIWKFYKLMKAIQYWGSYFETNGPARKLAAAHDEIIQSTWAFDNPARLAEFWGAAL